MATFGFIDEIAEVKRNESLTAFFTLKGSEEFLADHFSGFPVMPGVLMLESLKQAAQSLLVLSGDFEKDFFRLTGVEDAKFGQFVRPGNRLKVSVRISRKEGMTNVFDGRLDLTDPATGEVLAKALSAKLSLAPTRWSFKEKKDYFERLGGVRK